MTIKVLHITAHLGGGVGKVLSSLVEQSHLSNKFEHDIVCLEKPIKTQFANKISSNYGLIVIKPSISHLKELIDKYDIIQLEWWNHPTTIKYLRNIDTVHTRLITWFHQSGLNSISPERLITASHMFLFTSECSFKNKEIERLSDSNKEKIATVYSSGGFKDFPEQNHVQNQNIQVGYFGSMKFEKLHPQYFDYISAVKIPSFKVKMIGDVSDLSSLHAMNTLKEQCNSVQRPNLFEFSGYVQNPVTELSKINIIAYLLNPKHYGTAENSLLESMSMGIVPVVLNNPAEECIVENNETGLIVNNIDEFSMAVCYLHNNPEERQRIGENAAKTVRERFSIEKTESQLNEYYKKVMSQEKGKIDFKKICQDY